ncbi:pentatricopeptide repeat-containing protein At4g14170-like [Herrania umbratica]|uniref:Pentatricopeptide repeat-containing protein At4g14170-like n=1 Tax=Herrania umbratica TaxID=108875 RepID=A0A6J0ZW49_9ROSI|nr:pentatricopeptide repeat-containing protein At4g14170-like [Herrania umbratica]
MHVKPCQCSLTKALLSLCSKSNSFLHIKQTHALAILHGVLPTNIPLSAALILRYATFNSPSNCHLLFQQSLPYSQTPFLWNTFIRALSVARIYHDGFQFHIYNKMIRTGIKPDDHTFPFVLKACADAFCFQKGLEIHGTVIKTGFGSDILLGNTLLLFYGNFGGLTEARKVFDEMRDRDVVSWNTVLGVVSINGIYLEALNLFSQMNLNSGIRPNMVTFVSLLPVCGGVGDDGLVRQIHGTVVKVGLEFEVGIGNALVDAYGKCRNAKDSERVFDEMVEKNVVSWNARITSLAYMGLNKDALDMFRLMMKVGLTPDSITISSMIPVLVELEYFNLAKEIHGFSLRIAIEHDVFISNSLIDMYAKLGHSSAASNVFQQMKLRNIVSWNVMVANFAQNRLELAAIELLREMQTHGEFPDSITLTNVLPACGRVGFLQNGKEIHGRTIRLGSNFDLFVSNALTDMYAKCGYLNLAENCFKTSLKDEISYNILIAGYSQTSDWSKSVSLFSEMGLIGIKRDVVSFVGVISASANQAAFKQGKEIHGLAVRKHAHTHLFVANSLLDFYVKCGRIDLASKVFDQIQYKDVASWNTMLLGYGMLGQLNIAISLFEAMRKDGIEYDSVSYIAILSACSHGGLVEKGREYFEEMKAQKIKPTHMHYACMVDLLGRAGLLQEAAELIKSLSITPDANIWGALLGACRIFGNVELGCWAAENLFKLKPQHSGYYTILSNLFAEAGKWDDANRIRELMKLRGARKNPGCSWVHIQDQVHAFVAGQRLEKLDPALWLAEGAWKSIHPS